MPPKRDEAALQEEEELQLAIALSQSEAEEKERMVGFTAEILFYTFLLTACRSAKTSTLFATEHFRIHSQFHLYVVASSAAG